VSLPPELERFAEQAVAAGRLPDVSAAVVTGASLLLCQEPARAAFGASLEAAVAEGEREDFVTIEAVEREINGLIR
jgi:Arc/MetJ-type ribon-helix-helix transcriptional regulator